MRHHRFLSLLVAAAIALGGLVGGTPPGIAAQAERCFAETNQCIRGRFLDYWQRNGGLARNGFPLTGERRELLEDGTEYVVQYFERVRLEYHPENAPPYDVLLGQFGRRVSPFPAYDPLPEIDARFLGYWEATGALAQFGYPISRTYVETLEDGARYEVQYFERARFEWHPEHAGTPYAVLLGQFGRRVLAENELVAEPFRYWFVVRHRNGPPLGPATVTPASYQPFERGAMLYRADTRAIIFFPSNPTYCYSAADTWDPSQPVGGGPGPQPGLYEPSRGFGKLWRENQLARDLLGYAIAPEETGYTMATQQFVVRGARTLTATLSSLPDGVSARQMISGGSSAPFCSTISLR